MKKMSLEVSMSGPESLEEKCGVKREREVRKPSAMTSWMSFLSLSLHFMHFVRVNIGGFRIVLMCCVIEANKQIRSFHQTPNYVLLMIRMLVIAEKLLLT